MGKYRILDNNLWGLTFYEHLNVLQMYCKGDNYIIQIYSNLMALYQKFKVLKSLILRRVNLHVLKVGLGSKKKEKSKYSRLAIVTLFLKVAWSGKSLIIQSVL